MPGFSPLSGGSPPRPGAGSAAAARTSSEEERTAAPAAPAAPASQQPSQQRGHWSAVNAAEQASALVPQQQPPPQPSGLTSSRPPTTASPNQSKRPSSSEAAEAHLAHRQLPPRQERNPSPERMTDSLYLTSLGSRESDDRFTTTHSVEQTTWLAQQARDRQEEQEREREREREREMEREMERARERAREREYEYDDHDSDSPGPDDDDRDTPRGDDMSPFSSKRDYGNAFGSPNHDPRRGSTSALQSDSKKRKRNFSNRTKTGCLTCRKRKKKCDEAKPECNNCLRGGFMCQGYPPQRGTHGWQKPDSKGSVVPLEPKDPNYTPPNFYGIPQPQQPPPLSQQPPPQLQQPQQPLQPPPPPHPHPPHPQQVAAVAAAAHSAHAAHAPHATHGLPPPSRRESLYRGPSLRIDTPQTRIATDDDRPTGSPLASAVTTSPDVKMSALSAYTQNTGVFPTPISAASAHPSHQPPFPKDYARVPPLHDLSRADPQTPHPPSATEPLPRINVLRPPHNHSPVVLTTQPPPPQPPAAAAAAAAVLTTPSDAQLRPAHHALDPRIPFADLRPRSAKDDMLSSRLFSPFDLELRWDKERCSAALWRFNNAANPAMAISLPERVRLFHDIVVPREQPPHPPSVPGPTRGYVGEHVAVEAPFHCDYGFNLCIGRNVVIERNCTVADAAEVRIGDGCRIASNVCIYTTTLPDDPKLRRDPGCLTVARPVVIQEDCFIGGGAIILAGRTIGKGSIVGAGSVVSKDVPPYTVVAGNPAKVIRGVNTHGDDSAR